MELIDGGIRGWKAGDFICTRDGKHMGVVVRVHERGVDVLWDDLQLGHLLWDIDRPNNIDTVKQLTLHGHKVLRDFLHVPIEDLFRAAAKHVYPESFPRTRPSFVSAGDYLHAL